MSIENIQALRDFRPEFLKLSIPKATKSIRRPYVDVGEYLPPLEDGQIEFARINLASTTGDVMSLRIKKVKKKFIVNIVDEYETDYVDYKTVYDSIPTQGEVMDIITSMNNDYDSQPYWLAIFEEHEYDSIVQITHFIQFDSNIYLNLNELFVEYLIENGFER
jgi:hypothetical protein